MADNNQSKAKRPTAKKRQLQNEKKRVLNRTFNTRVRTAVRSYRSALKNEEKEQASALLGHVYSLFDKGVKKGLFKKNTAARSKARLASKLD